MGSIRSTLCLLLLVIQIIKDVRAAQRIKPWHALLIGTVAAIVYQGGFIIFNQQESSSGRLFSNVFEKVDFSVTYF